MTVSEQSSLAEKANIITTQAYIDLLEGLASGDPPAQQALWQNGLTINLQGLAMLENLPSEEYSEFRSNVLGIAAWLLLELGQPADALANSQRAMDMLAEHPVLWIRAPEQLLYLHSRALRFNQQIDLANHYLRQAHERLMVVHDSLQQAAHQRSWLENVRLNRMLLDDWRAITTH
jgi:hypothetical protein